MQEIATLMENRQRSELLKTFAEKRCDFAKCGR